MALVGEDLIAPTGALADSLLQAIGASRSDPITGDGAALAVAETIAEAADLAVAALEPPFTLATRAYRAARALAYVKAYEERAEQILSDAMSASGDRAGSVGYTTAQAVELRRKAAAYQAEYDAVVAEEAVAVGGGPVVRRRSSQSVRTRLAW